mmetsp:Transcript_31874/g.44440  ORF Transcript_31874/g.44440 Transcript_31874/m.44440 type:complete len:599 (+) Transcript_31874:37-1833(+)|eukprot:CAMPEP_0185260142 /NCGR_PEP_ID=MMETSP1359-20130426/8780_1 /TAXON_ID=552665 /ORGANISM="Bigelowiella longifila, Strain CCMP242" /LENGTH=598 /DNA_ID=CAMNT_0027846287 /DNA_START=29 /DNA_END=1825 /DNA_ORIENTATION=+
MVESQYKEKSEASLLNGHLDPNIASNFGKKTISPLSSYALLLNNITGPGLVAMCVAYQHGGWFPATSLLFGAAVGALLSAGFLVETMTRFHGNEHFEGRVEFMEMARALFPRWGYYIVFILFLFNITTSNVSAILESAQTLDQTILMIFGQVCALELSPDFGVVCVTESSMDVDSVFGDNIEYVSGGFVALAIISIPIGFWNLEENMIIQMFSFIALCVLLAEFCIQFFHNGLHPEYLPVSRLNNGAGATLGSILFNFAFVVTVPSWVNEKRKDVRIHETLSSTISTGTLMFALMGCVGAMAYQFPNGADLLTKLSMPSQWFVTRVLAQLFPPLVLVPGIPILSIIVRYNLLENRVCGPFNANMIAVVLPWLIAFLTMSGNKLNIILNWSGLLTVVPLNFLIPCAMYLISRESKGVCKMTSITTTRGDSKEDSAAAAAAAAKEKQAAKMKLRRRDSKGESGGCSVAWRSSQICYYGSTEQDPSPSPPPQGYRHQQKLVNKEEEVEEGEDEFPDAAAPFRVLPCLSREQSHTVAWVVIIAVSLINCTAIFFAVSELIMTQDTQDGIPPPPPVEGILEALNPSRSVYVNSTMLSGHGAHS